MTIQGTAAKIEISSGREWTSIPIVGEGSLLHAFALSSIPAVQEEAARLRALEEESYRAWAGMSWTFTGRAERFNWRLLCVLCGDHQQKIQRYRKLQPYYKMMRKKKSLDNSRGNLL